MKSKTKIKYVEVQVADLPDYPLFLFEYDAQGYHGPGQRIDNEEELNSFKPLIAKALVERREIRITDVADYCVFHAVDGNIEWPTLDKE